DLLESSLRKGLLLLRVIEEEVGDEIKTSMEDVEGCLWCRRLYGAKGRDVAILKTKKWIVVLVSSLWVKVVRWVRLLDMQVTLYDKRIVMQVTLHYEAIVMQVTLHDKRIVMQVTLHYEAIVMQVTLHDKRIEMQVTLHYEAILMQVTLHDKRIVMQVTKVDSCKALNAGLIVTKSNETELERVLPTSKSSCPTTIATPNADHSRKSSPFFDFKHFVCSTCQKCVFSANHDVCITKFLKEVNSHVKIQSPKSRDSTKAFKPMSHTQKPSRKIVTVHRFSPNKSSDVHEKTNTPRSCLRWIPTGRIFNTVGLSSGLALYEMTPTTISSRLMSNPLPSTPFVPPSRTDWDILFQPLFDELLTPPPSVDHPAPEVIAPVAKVVAPEPVA
nr:hypothetical protein [Tanacetum cinerariifolium]